MRSADCVAAEPQSLTARRQGPRLECIDDPVTLVDLRPVSVELHCGGLVLESVDCGSPGKSDRHSPIVVGTDCCCRCGQCGSAGALAGGVVMRPRSWLLRQAARPESRHGAVVVEIADGVVVITGATGDRPQPVSRTSGVSPKRSYGPFAR